MLSGASILILCITLIEQIVLSNNWHVASGEESEEVKVQNSREARVLEAVYPRISAIPPK